MSVKVLEFFRQFSGPWIVLENGFGAWKVWNLVKVSWRVLNFSDNLCSRQRSEINFCVRPAYWWKKMLLNVPVALRTLSVANSCSLRCPCAGQKFMTHLEDERKKDCRPEEERSGWWWWSHENEAGQFGVWGGGVPSSLVHRRRSRGIGPPTFRTGIIPHFLFLLFRSYAVI